MKDKSPRGEGNKLAALAVNQNLLLWHLTASFLDLERKIIESTSLTSND